MRRKILAVALLAVTACSQPGGDRIGVVELSGRAPSVAGSLMGGGRFDPSDYRGEALVVNFFNPFCRPCQQEQPVLEREWRRLRSEGVQFVGIHYVGGQWPTSVSAARSYLRRMNVTYPVLEDPGSRLALSFAIQGIPSTVIVGTGGDLRFRVLGKVEAGELSDLIRDISSRSD